MYLAALMCHLTYCFLGYWWKLWLPYFTAGFKFFQKIHSGC
jgi:hypothetical protein